MKIIATSIRVLVPSLWVTACGPTITIESGEDDSTTAVPSTTTGTVPMTTAGPTTTPPGDTTVGSVDTGPFDSGEVETGQPWLDFPEYCSTVEQDCPPGYKCMPYSNDGGSWNDTMCVPIVPDPNAAGEPCTVEGSANSGLDDCDGTSMCWDIDPETNMGTCVPFCIGEEANPYCADRCDFCTISGDGTLTLCLDTCDPIAQDCARGQACYPINDDFACAPDASPEGAEIGTPCEFINVCPPGLACLSAAAVPGCMGGVGCCAPYCAVGGADPCPGLLPGSECMPWYEEGDGPPEACVTSEPGVCVDPSA